MTRTTRPPWCDVEEQFPFLAGTARTAIRLHPSRATGLPPDVSKIGGAIVWPSGEPYPVCPATGCRAVPVLQVLKQDVPGVEFPEGANLLQVLWYPRGYEECMAQPKVELFWREASALSGDSVLGPVYENHEENFVLHECQVTPEEVIEYPSFFALSSEQRDEIEEWQYEIEDTEGTEEAYAWCHAVCPGTKISGYPNWGGQDPISVVNAQGQELEYFLTISDDEWDDGTCPRWRPVEQDALPEDQRDNSQIRAPLGTYLKDPLNVYLDKTATPWAWKTGFEQWASRH